MSTDPLHSPGPRHPATRWVAVGVVVFATTLLGACGNTSATGPDDGPRPASPSEPLGLDGREFVSQSVLEGGQERALVDGTRVRLDFRDGTLNASAGCNAIGGAYAVDGATLVLEALSMTEIGCEPPLMEQDAWLVDFLSDQPTIALTADTLTLSTEETAMTLLDTEAAEPDQALLDTRWELDSVVEGTGEDATVSGLPVGVSAALSITEDPQDPATYRAAVATGCNAGRAQVELTEDELTFGPMALTRKACPPAATAIEQAVVQTLTGTVGYAIDANRLAITGERGGLRFTAG